MLRNQPPIIKIKKKDSKKILYRFISNIIDSMFVVVTVTLFLARNIC